MILSNCEHNNNLIIYPLWFYYVSALSPSLSLSLPLPFPLSLPPPSLTHARTHTHKYTLIFLSHMCTYTIHRPSTDEAVTTEGAVLFLSLFNHPVIGSDSFTAMCAIACKDIPHSTSDNPQRKNLILPLFQFIDLTFATAELEFRAECGDGKASSFLKSNIIKKVLSFLPRPRSRSRSRSRSNSSVSYLENSQAVQLNSK